MMVKLGFCNFSMDQYPDVDMLRGKDVNSFATECVPARRPKRCLPPLPEDKECSSTELRKIGKVMQKRWRHRWLPALVEHEEP